MAHAQDDPLSTDDLDAATRPPREESFAAVDATNFVPDSPQSLKPEQRVSCPKPEHRRIDPFAIFVHLVLLPGPFVAGIVLIVLPSSQADAPTFKSGLLATLAVVISFSIASITFSVIKWRAGLLFLSYVFIDAIALILVFAKLDWALSMRDHKCFTEVLSSRTDAFYFAVTTFTSGGPENISPTTTLCRQLITEAYAKPGYEFCDHVIDLRGRQFLIMLSRGFA